MMKYIIKDGDEVVNGDTEIVSCATSGEGVYAAWCDAGNRIYLINLQLRTDFQQLAWPSANILSLKFVSDHRIIGAGVDCIPICFRRFLDRWECEDLYDTPPQWITAQNEEDPMGEGKQRVHSHAIIDLSVITSTQDFCEFSTLGIDGCLCVWGKSFDSESPITPASVEV
eukprot:GHVO01016745.1.p2 GENE.GHVO01016745.1~~GHVO01016745.1.p2  ORF type:complete len:170 (-),score=30.05 GHVO01016745.1:101-610(-)